MYELSLVSFKLVLVATWVILDKSMPRILLLNLGQYNLALNDVSNVLFRNSVRLLLSNPKIAQIIQFITMLLIYWKLMLLYSSGKKTLPVQGHDTLWMHTNG